MSTRSRSCLLAAALLAGTGMPGAPAGRVGAAEIHVAVASNFAAALEVLAQRFESDTGHRLLLSRGSTGKHYAQIRNGAPYAVFFAADARRPELLERDGIAVAGSRFTYAVGRLVLWSPRPHYVTADAASLRRQTFRYLAIANPALAPYGEAARQTLESLGLWEALRERVVRGQNIAQTFQFVATGNAELGFVAASQIMRDGAPVAGSHWEIPPSMHRPIEQQAVLLRDDRVARALVEFVRGDEARAVIERFGYAWPVRGEGQRP